MQNAQKIREKVAVDKKSAYVIYEWPPSHLYEFPVSQLPPGYHKTRGLSTITGGPTSGTIPLTAFEFYFYHFVSLLVRFLFLSLHRKYYARDLLTNLNIIP